jgi:hypothetical protein
MPVLSECPSRVTWRTITGRSTRRAPRLIGCTVRRAATAAALLFASLVSVGAQAQLTPDRAVSSPQSRLLGVGVPNPEDTGRLGIRITPQFLALPDVHELGWLTYCGPGGSSYHQDDPVGFSIQFLERRLATMPR